VRDTGDPIAIESPKKEYSPYLDHNYPDEMFFGDTHLHTPYSTFKFGMIGSTDSHTLPATLEEDNYFGKGTPGEPSVEPDRFQEVITGFMQQPGGFDTRHLEQEERGIAVRMVDVGRSAMN
jgi:hypothetical protein